jgi:hypothetical protein
MRCATHDCGFEPCWMVWWPGSNPSAAGFCERCTCRAREVAKVMGFELPTVWVDVFLADVQARARIQDAVDRLTGEKPPESGQGVS